MNGTLQLQGNFELVVTIFLDADINDQAYIFSIINTTQSKLDPSLVHDLTELSKITTPENVVHTIAKVFNEDKSSPWFQSIKRLGRKDQTSKNGIISQYTFNKSILKYMYDKKFIFKIRNILIKNNDDRKKLLELKIDSLKYPFWNYYVSYKENIIYSILFTYFSSLKEFYGCDKWCNEQSILCKTSGYDAFMKLFYDFYLLAKCNEKVLCDKTFYIDIMNAYYKNLDIDADANKLGAAGASNLYKMLKEKFPCN